MKFAHVNYTSGCCGVAQITNMQSHESDLSEDTMIEVEGDDWAEVLNKITYGVDHGLVLQVWFVERCNWDGFRSGRWDATELRDLVRNIPGVVSLGEFCNPNTSNFIDGYQWVNVQ
jgi:hypothetical protein